MTNNFHGPDEDELWIEFGDGKTTWERKVEILVSLAALQAHKQNWSKEIRLLETAADMATEHNIKLESYRINNIIAARQLRFKGDAEEAIRRADIVLNAEPNFVPDEEIIKFINQAYCRKGSALIMLKRYAEAVHVFKIVNEYGDMLDDGSEVAHANTALMRCYIELDEIEKAKQAGAIAKELYQDNSRIMELLEVDRLFAKIALLEGNYSRAKIALKEVRLLEQRLNHSSDVETKLLLGRVHLELEEFEKAERVLKRAYDTCVNGWSMDFANGLEAGLYLVECLAAQEKMDEANRIAAECKALAKRAPGVKQEDLDSQYEEVGDLLVAGKPELAVLASKNLMDNASEKGNIRARWVAFDGMLRGYWQRDDFQSMLELWDTTKRESLDFQDDLVVPIKNMITHALQKMGRTGEALALNNEVLADSRVGNNPMELLYAKENAARINKELANHKQALKLKDETVKQYLELGCPDRALGLIEYFDKRKKRGQGK
ncbi:MAG: hypothetical protein ACKOFA_06445 [Rhodoluna sp.]